MFYSQTCENIKLIIFTLDGGLLDLNRLGQSRRNVTKDFTGNLSYRTFTT